MRDSSPHPVIATYQGDQDYGGSSAALTQQVTAAATTTVVDCSPNPSASGARVDIVITVSSAAGKPPGPVRLTIGGRAYSEPLALRGGCARFPTISTLAGGSHALEAIYVGGDYARSSGPLVQRVAASGGSSPGPGATDTWGAGFLGPGALLLLLGLALLGLGGRWPSWRGHRLPGH